MVKGVTLGKHRWYASAAFFLESQDKTGMPSRFHHMKTRLLTKVTIAREKLENLEKFEMRPNDTNRVIS